MGKAGRVKGLETREFWNEAVRLWADSGRSVRDFCRREGLNEHSFYAWRRMFLPKVPAVDSDPTSSVEDGDEAVPVRRQRRRRRAPTGDASDKTVAASFVELAAPMAAERCQCELELEGVGGAKMRIQLTSAAMPDLAAICQSFWNGRNGGNGTL